MVIVSRVHTWHKARERERERAMAGNSETGERELEVAKPEKPSRIWAGER